MLQSEHDSVRSDVDVDVDRYQCYQYLVFVRRSVCRCACDRCPFPTPSTSLYSAPGWGMCQNEVRRWLAQFIIYPGIATLRLIDMTGLAQSLTQTLVHPLATHTHSIWGLWHDSFALDLVVQIERAFVCALVFVLPLILVITEIRFAAK